MTAKLEYTDTADATCKHPACVQRNLGTYLVRGACTNCGWKGKVLLSREHHMHKVTCPTCSTPNVGRLYG